MSQEFQRELDPFNDVVFVKEIDFEILYVGEGGQTFLEHHQLPVFKQMTMAAAEMAGRHFIHNLMQANVSDLPMEADASVNYFAVQ